MTNTKLLTAKELAGKAGITPQILRSPPRKEFDRAGKTLVEGNSAAIFIFRNLKPEGWHTNSGNPPITVSVPFVIASEAKQSQITPFSKIASALRASQ